MTIGACPIGVRPLTAPCGPRTHGLSIPDPVEFWFEVSSFAVSQSNVWYIPDVEFFYEVSDVNIVQESVYVAGDVEYFFDFPDVDPQTDAVGFPIEQTHLLSFEDIEISWVLVEPDVRQVLVLEAFEDVEFFFEIDCETVDPPCAYEIHQIVAPKIPPVELEYEIEGPAIVQTLILAIEANELFIAVPDLWLFLPTRCLSFSSTRERDGGLLIDAEPDGTPLAERWYSEDRYRFTLVWDDISIEYVRAIRGFFESYRFKEFVFTWPEDSTTYQSMITNDITVNPATAYDGWRASVEIIGTQIYHTPTGMPVLRLGRQR